MVDFISKDGKVTAIVDDEVLPVTDLFDANGEDCDLANAVIAVAGPDKHGQWLTLDVTGPLTRLS